MPVLPGPYEEQEGQRLPGAQTGQAVESHHKVRKTEGGKRVEEGRAWLKDWVSDPTESLRPGAALEVTKPHRTHDFLRSHQFYMGFCMRNLPNLGSDWLR